MRGIERMGLVRVLANGPETTELAKDLDHMRDTEKMAREKLLEIALGSVLVVVQARLLGTDHGIALAAQAILLYIDRDIALAARVTLPSGGCNVARVVLARLLASTVGSWLEVRASVRVCSSHVVMVALVMLLEQWASL